MGRTVKIAMASLLTAAAGSSDAGAKELPAFVSFGVRQPLLVLIIDNDGADESGEDPAAADDGKELVYAPEIPTIGSVGVSFNHLSASYSHNLDGEDEDKLEYTDYRLNLFFESIGVDASYSEFKRFEITDSTGFAAPLTLEEIRKPEMRTRFYSLNSYWFPLRINFGLDRSLEPNELKKTGFGLGAIGSLTQTQIDTPTGFVPEAYQNAFGPDGRVGMGTFSSAGIQAALAFTLAPGPLYLSAMAAAGIGSQQFSYKNGTGTISGNGISDKENFVVSVGYSAHRTFLSLKYGAEAARYVLENMSIMAESSDLSAVFGVKF
jgi:hypothetical protein